VTFYCRVQDRPVLLGVCRKSTDYSHHRVFRKISLFLQVLSTLGIFLGTITVQTALKPYSQTAHNTLETRACSLLCVGIVGKRLIFAFVSLLNAVFTVLCFYQIAYSAVGALTKLLRKKT